MNNKFDNLVVGGGIVGVSIAYHLSKTPSSKTILLEKNAIGSGATSMSAGTIAASMSFPNPKIFTPFLTFHTIKTIHEVEKSGFPTSWVNSGDYTFATNKASLNYLKNMNDFAKTNGLVSRWLDLDELTKTLPNISKSTKNNNGVLAATFNELSGQVNPSVLVEAIAAAATENGAILREGENVINIEKCGFLKKWFFGCDYEVETESGERYSENMNEMKILNLDFRIL